MVRGSVTAAKILKSPESLLFDVSGSSPGTEAKSHFKTDGDTDAEVEAQEYQDAATSVAAAGNYTAVTLSCGCLLHAKCFLQYIGNECGNNMYVLTRKGLAVRNRVSRAGAEATAREGEGEGLEDVEVRYLLCPYHPMCEGLKLFS